MDGLHPSFGLNTVHLLHLLYRSMSLTFFFKVVCPKNASEDQYKWPQGKNSSGQEGNI